MEISNLHITDGFKAGFPSQGYFNRKILFFKKGVEGGKLFDQVIKILNDVEEFRHIAGDCFFHLGITAMVDEGGQM